jgi:hypothetical protein
VTDPRVDPQVAPDPHATPAAAAGPGIRFEQEDVSPGAVVRWAIGLGVLTIAFAAVSVWLLVLLRRGEENRDPPRPALYFADEHRQPDGVRLQASPFTDLRALREEERQVLGSYGWVDEAAGVVRIPIDEAMRLYLARQAGAGAAAASPSPEAAVPTDSAPVPPPAVPVAAPVTEPSPPAPGAHR